MKVLTVLMLFILLSEGQMVTFDLSNYDPANKSTHTHKLLANLTAGITEIQVTNVPEGVGFYVVQAHSFRSNVTLSDTSKMKRETSVSGTNVGLVHITPKDHTYYLKTYSQLSVLVVITIYQASDPIPGGCNLSFPTEIAPYQIVSNTDDLMVVQSQPPSAPKMPCEKDNVQVDIYHLYLRESNYDESLYFKGLEDMLTVDSIKTNGYRVRTGNGYFKYRHLYSSYVGIGHVFGIVATYGNRSSAYVPAASYGCNITNPEENCSGPITGYWKLICAFLLIFGGFVCLFGHKYFRLTMYIIGFTVGVFITYLILSANPNYLTVPEKTTTSLVVGLIYGLVWLFVWWKFGIPIVSVVFTYLMGGFLMASIIFYAGLADFSIFHSDINFWLTFVALVIANIILSTMFPLKGHVFACSFLGAYAFVAALNFYIGGNLQYVVINTFRRFVVKNFNVATVDPPFQLLDGAQTLLLALMTSVGYYYQMREQRNKPPFPPHRYGAIAERVDETTPLVSNSGVIYSDI